MTKYIIQGQGPVNLTQADFLASGGEGTVWVKGASVIKVYHDAARMLPIGKITELRQIKDPDVICPQSIVATVTGHPVGYTMRLVQGALPLCQTFTRAFREREGLDEATALRLVQLLQERVQHVHEARILLVDLNEMNFLVDVRFQNVYAIDTDSYQTPNYPATALMPSVKDWSVRGAFSEGSDWFSFACVAFQMFTGIHPYKGRHPRVTGLEDRMKQNISVFSKDVTVPKVVYPFSVIPKAYLEWFKAVLQDGRREPPPGGVVYGQVQAFVSRVVSTQGTLQLHVVWTAPASIRAAYVNASVSLYTVGPAREVKDGPSLTFLPDPHDTPFLTATRRYQTPVVVLWRGDGSVRLRDLRAHLDLPAQFQAEAVTVTDGRAYLLNAGSVFEIVYQDGAQVTAACHQVASVLPKASRLFSGCVIQDVLGSKFVSVFPSSRIGHQVRVPELDKFQIVDAKFHRRVLMVSAAQGGQLHRHVFVWDEGFSSYRHSLLRDVSPSLNFVVLDSGVMAFVNEDEDLEIEHLGSGKKRVISDPAFGNDFQLFELSGRVGAIRGDTVFSVKVS